MTERVLYWYDKYSGGVDFEEVDDLAEAASWAVGHYDGDYAYPLGVEVYTDSAAPVWEPWTRDALFGMTAREDMSEFAWLCREEARERQRQAEAVRAAAAQRKLVGRVVVAVPEALNAGRGELRPLLPVTVDWFYDEADVPRILAEYAYLGDRVSVVRV